MPKQPKTPRKRGGPQIVQTKAAPHQGNRRVSNLIERDSGRKIPLSPHFDPFMRSAVDAVPQEDLIAAFNSSDDPRFKALLTAMTTPGNQHMTMLTLMRKHDITMAALLDCWKDHNHAVALMRAQAGVAQVYADVIEDAKSQRRVCPDCNNNPVFGDPACPTCEGSGHIRVKGDDVARKMVFESMGWAGKKAPLINNQNLFAAPQYPQLSKTAADVSRLLEAPEDSTTIEAEIIEQDETH